MSFSPNAELRYWYDHPFNGADKDESTFNTVANVEFWWKRKGFGGSFINLFCRQNIYVLRTRLAEIRELVQTVRGNPSEAFLFETLEKDAANNVLEDRMQYVVNILKILTTFGKVPALKLKNAVTVRQTRVELKIGAVIDDWANQFLSVSPDSETAYYKSNAFEEMVGDSFHIVWPKGDINAWYINDQEVVLPMGCTFQVVEDMKMRNGTHHWGVSAILPEAEPFVTPGQATAKPDIDDDVIDELCTYVVDKSSRNVQRRFDFDPADAKEEVDAAVDQVYSMLYKQDIETLNLPKKLCWYGNVAEFVNVDDAVQKIRERHALHKVYQCFYEDHATHP